MHGRGPRLCRESRLSRAYASRRHGQPGKRRRSEYLRRTGSDARLAPDVSASRLPRKRHAGRADALGFGNELGSIAVGKRAELYRRAHAAGHCGWWKNTL